MSEEKDRNSYSQKEIPKCSAYNKTGRKCGSPVYDGSKYCYIHTLLYGGKVSFWSNPRVHLTVAIVSILVTILCTCLTSWFGTTKHDLISRQLEVYKETNSELLKAKYPLGYVLFSIRKDSKEITPMRGVDLKNCTVNFNKCRILKITSNHVIIESPEIEDLRTTKEKLSQKEISPLITYIRMEQFYKGKKIQGYTLKMFVIADEDILPELDELIVDPGIVIIPRYLDLLLTISEYKESYQICYEMLVDDKYDLICVLGFRENTFVELSAQDGVL